MKHHVEIIDWAPKDLFQASLQEVTDFDWVKFKQHNYDVRSLNSVFQKSTSVHIRIHKPGTGKGMGIVELASSLDAVSTHYSVKFPNTNRLVDWMYKRVQGKRLGRVMIVMLEPHSNIDLHTDPGLYFNRYYRFHVPLITDPRIVFVNGKDEGIHMPVGTLCQLNNRVTHGVENNSDFPRIHVIADIMSDDIQYIIER